MISLLPEQIEIGLAAEEQEKLTDYATVTRYPGDYEAIRMTEARRAVTLARRIRRIAREQLPKGALRH